MLCALHTILRALRNRLSALNSILSALIIILCLDRHSVKALALKTSLCALNTIPERVEHRSVCTEHHSAWCWK